jgi:hypothetical protein
MGVHPYLGTNVSPTQVQEILYRGLLHKEETLFALFDGILFDEQGQHVGGLSLSDFLVLTDQRLITWARGVFSDTVDGFLWKDVDVIEARTWDPLHGSISLAFRIAPVVSTRPPRVAVKSRANTLRAVEEAERIVINKLDYVPAADVPVMEEMVAWIGDQVVAGMQGDKLLTAFAETFTVSQAPALPAPQPTYSQPQSSSDYYQESRDSRESQAPRRRWWSFGKKDQQDVSSDLADNPERLVAAYELQRGTDYSYRPQSSQFPSSSTGSSYKPSLGNSGVGPLGRSASSVTSVVDRMGVYDVSRGLRMLIEAPRQMSGPFNQLINGAAEIVGSLQDSELGKRASAGLQIAMDNADEIVEKREQAKSSAPPNIFGLVGPVVQAVLGGNDAKDGKGQGKGKDSGRHASRRRIQINDSQQQRTLRPAAMRSHDDTMADTDADEAGYDATALSETPALRSNRATVVKQRRPVVVRKSSSTTRSVGVNNGSTQSTNLSSGEEESDDS